MINDKLINNDVINNRDGGEPERTERVIRTRDTTLCCVGADRVEVSPSPDGPLLVRGAEMIIDEDGDEHAALRPVVALCRCGGSTEPPWCDGMHKLLRRRDRKQRSRSGTDGTDRPDATGEV